MQAAFKIGFLEITPVDVVDVLLVAFILFQLYRLVRGSLAINIFIGLLMVYVLSLIAAALELTLMSDILGAFIDVGVIAVIIVFQPEIRRFLLYVGRSSDFRKVRFWKALSLRKIRTGEYNQKEVNALTEAIMALSESKTGALIVIPQTSQLGFYQNTGIHLNALITKDLIESIFYKNSPLHDGAMIISEHRIAAVKCILPLSDNPDLPGKLGMRHRSGVGITEQSDATCIIISEENGEISYAREGKLYQQMQKEEIRKLLSRALFHSVN
ncbi:MAG TPA: diadenylate cyclase CdaA [Chitinophagales bacterium]|nr:diadenylate cyclase CdaA [Chitinophagales bacterium]HMX03810.1 diadenylate cyclase CdaA [Chitinophagales bacterium]HMZ89998.1 diadenylate cyclase CdaA [Chitinophagales bacterium]HNA58345.1 diadenylate cyclase CdaA [Chitinophagales bacterium]HNE46778.1 diadenylate cyclase CdaA [Chitinophagales bacterium]